MQPHVVMHPEFDDGVSLPQTYWRDFKGHVLTRGRPVIVSVAQNMLNTFDPLTPSLELQ